MDTDQKTNCSNWVSRRLFVKPGASGCIRVVIVLFILILSLGEPGIQSAAVESARLDPAQIPLEELVQVDGSLDLDRCGDGALELSGWEVTLDSQQGPLLAPEGVNPGWHPLGSGLNNGVIAIAVSGGNVYVGGSFIDAGGDPDADYIARWDGTAWHSLGSGLNGWVYAIAISGGEVYVGGEFFNAGGDPDGDYIARWDGAAWHPLGSGLNGWVDDIAVSGSNLYMGGEFINAGGDLNADYIARWDGAAWHALGGGLDSVVYTVAVSGGNVYAGGWFLDAGGNPNADYIARWDGTAWHALGSGLTNAVNVISVSGSNLYAGGLFLDAGGNPNADAIARWDGSAWYPLGSGLNGWVNTIAASGSNLYVGGWFADAGGNPNADNITRWDGAAWHPLDGGLADAVIDIVVSGDDLYVGGWFSDAGGNPAADNIARYGVMKTFLPIVMTCRDIIVNGGFENDGGWQIPATAYSAGYSTGLFYTGARSMRTGILDKSQNVFSYSDFEQKVTIPAGTTATLAARLYRMSGEPDATHGIPIPENFSEIRLEGGTFPADLQLAGDAQYILVLDNNKVWIDTLLWQKKDAPEWTYRTFDLSQYAGKTIWLHFGTYNDGSDGVTSMHVDAVSLMVCP